MIPNPFVPEPDGDPIIVPPEIYPTPFPIAPVDADDAEVDETPWDVEVDDPTAPLEREASLGEPEYLDRPTWLEEVAPG